MKKFIQEVEENIINGVNITKVTKDILKRTYVVRNTCNILVQRIEGHEKTDGHYGENEEDVRDEVAFDNRNPDNETRISMTNYGNDYVPDYGQVTKSKVDDIIVYVVLACRLEVKKKAIDGNFLIETISDKGGGKQSRKVSTTPYNYGHKDVLSQNKEGNLYGVDLDFVGVQKVDCI